MPFFVSWKKIDREVEKHLDELVKRQGLSEMQTAFEDTIRNVDSVRSDCESGLRELEEHMNSRLGEVNAHVNSRLGEVDEHVNSGLRELKDRLDCKLTEVSGRLDRVEKINGNKGDADIKAEVMNYVDSLTEDIIKNIEKNVSINEDKLRQEIRSAVESSIRSDFYDYVARMVNMQIQSIKSDNDNRNLQIVSLRKEIEQGRESNARLLEMIQKQEGELVQLTELIRQLQDKVVISFPNIEDRAAWQKQGQNTADKAARQVQEQDAANQFVPAKIVVLFGDDAKENEMTLKRFQAETRKLREEVVKNLKACENLEICLKLVDKCLKKFGNLLEKFKEKQYDSDKLANESAKILKQTIVLAMSQEALKPYIDRYMEGCGVRKLNWVVGKRLTAEDYNYLNEQILYDDVAESALNNTITAICQDAFVIDYQEDHKPYEAIVPGIYHIGKYKG